MNALVVYDSAYGNTGRVAETVARTLGGPGAHAVRVADVTDEMLRNLDVLVVGSPTQKFRPLPSVQRWLDALGPGALRGVRVAAFDTRLNVAQTGSRVLSFMVAVQGGGAYAAPHLARALQRHGGFLAQQPRGFDVEGQEGPLRPGELAQAARWAAALTTPGDRRTDAI